MIYLSQILQKPVFSQGKLFGKILDIAVVENRPTPPISKIVIQKGTQKITVSPAALVYEKDHFSLKNQPVPFLPYDEKDFYLSEDLLDKQVIDVDGRRVVRVNDVILESNGEFKVMGIDIGIPGILRRLGIDIFFPIKIKSKTLPWSLIQAFDYQTGAIQLRITQNRLSSFHPAEIADILEEVGAKERVGIINVLDAQIAAIALENSDNETQVSVLEQLSPTHLKDIINRMLVSEIADIFYRLNPLRLREVTTLLGSEKVNRVKRLSVFADDDAGGLMRLTYHQVDANKTVKEVLAQFQNDGSRPEAIIVTNGNQRIVGTILIKDLLLMDSLALLKDIVSIKQYVYPEAHLSQIIRIFSSYNLRLLPVVDREKHVLGVITIDTVLELFQQEEEKNDIL